MFRPSPIYFLLRMSRMYQEGKADKVNRKANDMRMEGKLEEADHYVEKEQGKLDFNFGCVTAIFILLIILAMIMG